jgi:hypothetical protein
MKIRERFNAWVQGMVNEAVKQNMEANPDLMFEFSQRLDYTPLACLIAANEDLTSRVVSEVKEGVADEIDTARIAEQIAETISAEDVAYHMDAEDVAGHVDVDTDEIAEKVAEEIDVSSCIDYDTLAEKLVEKLKEAWA